MRKFPSTILVMILLALAGCAPAPASATPGPTPPASMPPGTAPAYQDCAWQWATQTLADVTTAFHEALATAGLPFAPEMTTVYGFGENCLDHAGKVQYFATMETDFVVALAPDDPADIAALGNYCGDVLGLILSDFAPGAVLGPQPGNVEFVFLTADGETRHRVLLDDAKVAVQSGSRGADLYQALFP